MIAGRPAGHGGGRQFHVPPSNPAGPGPTQARVSFKVKSAWAVLPDGTRFFAIVADRTHERA